MEDYDNAYKCYKKAVRLDSSDAVARYNLGVIFEEKGRDEDADRSFKKTLELGTTRTSILLEIGYFYYQ